jgi:N-acetylmuramoyl-L-alanine amidase
MTFIDFSKPLKPTRPREKQVHGLRGGWTLALFLLVAGWAGGQNPISTTATLRMADGSAQLPVPLLKDAEGKTYLPLKDTVKFYGIDLQMDDLDGKITLQKGKVRVRLVLSQSAFLLMENQDSYPMDPAETVGGEIGIPPGSAEDVLSALLDEDVRWDWDQQTLVAGDVNAQELRQEIMKAKTAPTTAVTAPIDSAQPEAIATPLETESAEKETPEAEADQTPPPPPSVVEDERVSDAKKLMIRRIVIDPGHGGKDYGASGFDRRYYEKQATLSIAKKVVQLLQKDQDLQVYLTRTSDYYISLKYRTDFANIRNADLFVSIHCNSNPKSKASGTETYVYGARASNQVAAFQASRENDIERGDFIDTTFNDLIHNAFGRTSRRLAHCVEENIRQNLGQALRRIQTAPFYVLCHVNMPSILIETAFISNPKEEQKLRNDEWQNKIARSIADGILAYRDIVEKTQNDNRQAMR